MGLATAWIRVRTVLAVLKIVRFSLVIPAVLVIAVIVSAQMRDILRSIGENAHGGQIAALLITSAFTALVVWYTARTMLRFEFEGNPASNAAVMPAFKRHLPRLLAVSRAAGPGHPCAVPGERFGVALRRLRSRGQR